MRVGFKWVYDIYVVLATEEKNTRKLWHESYLIVN